MQWSVHCLHHPYHHSDPVLPMVMEVFCTANYKYLPQPCVLWPL
jgi:hypothetical protein